MNEDLTFQILRQLQANPKQSQRQLSEAIGISVGRANFILRALIERGLIKVEHFRNSKKKRAYAYLLTPEGLEQKARITARFIQRKRAEYDALRAELDQLSAEVEAEDAAEGLLPPDPSRHSGREAGT